MGEDQNDKKGEITFEPQTEAVEESKIDATTEEQQEQMQEIAAETSKNEQCNEQVTVEQVEEEVTENKVVPNAHNTQEATLSKNSVDHDVVEQKEVDASVSASVEVEPRNLKENMQE